MKFMSIFGRFFFFFSHIDFLFRKFFFYECSWSLWVFLKYFSFFESYIDFSCEKNFFNEFLWSLWVFLEDFSFFVVILILYLKIFFLWIFMKFMNIFERFFFYEFSWSLWVFSKDFSFFESYTDFSFKKIILNKFSWSLWVFLEDFFLFLSHILICHLKKFFFYEFSWSLWVFLEVFSFFESCIDFSSLIAWRSVHPLKSWEFFVHVYQTSQLFELFRLFKSYEFFSKRLHFSSFEKALIDTSNLSIYFLLIKFVIFFVKKSFLNFTMLF